MLRVVDNDDPSGGYPKTFSGSVSWIDSSPVKSISRPKFSGKARALLPPLQPLSISRPKAEWPKAGSDDLGVWPCPATPGVRTEPVKLVGSKLDLGQGSREFEFKKDKLAFFEKDCSRITENIYVGSDAVAKNREILQQNGITHVLNCVGFVCPEYFKGDLKYMTLWLRDSPSEDITSILYDVFDYFEDVRQQNGRVLVHCCQGVSRSNSLVIAYLMWRDKQSYEDAFHYVKAARGVTNPNMGFACQLLLCQKRVHAMPPSPSSVLRMYRVASHSQYDPLHLVPKLLSNPGVDSLDSRGAFIVHIPSAIYVWVGKNCTSVMSDNARIAALQVIRYEKAQVSVLTIRESEETSEFWKALGTEPVSVDEDCNKVPTKKCRYYSAEIDKIIARICPGVGERTVKAYDLDFEIFHKALYGGIVPPSALFKTGSETCLPARENGWGKLQLKFANGDMNKIIALSKVSCDTIQQSHRQVLATDTCRGVESNVYDTDNQVCIMDTGKEGENSIPYIDALGSLSPPSCLLDNFSSYLSYNPKFSSSSPSLSPSFSDYSDPFTISSSSSPLSEMSYFSAQASPAMLEHSDPYPAKNQTSLESACVICKQTLHLPVDAISTRYEFEKTCLSCIETRPSIVERRGSKSFTRIMLHAVPDAPQVEATM